MEFISQQITLFYNIFKFLLPAIPATIKITVISFLFASVMGLLTSAARQAKYKLLNIPAKIYIDVVHISPIYPACKMLWSDFIPVNMFPSKLAINSMKIQTVIARQ